ncbi:sulfite exporter TauE/SafE family protein [Pigmentiphaga sp.]|uniref:sulfite exporter TauE/SafE family protein n=1 Tax=Pigmentiphaga sp. TaxID=1977564 RepID=UPI00128B443F|nr:sulfite exporter TauE/SafE family protein [Pigmentiphaga sp.]MPS29175.1 sulfite exporter TauE/SafE family protein [Alcaligenaceae bacterium SAGV5]MPS50479.1 sulfite exporter TauE/SafE family protein [Alcaligenaceae bacterium SAGV3]MPT59786.1 sulfite exporter TauE/SafE family protein [Alcaligenaceae bacterium]
MTAGIFAIVSLLTVFASFLSGVFGMAGGMVLMGALLLLMPVTAAMVVQSVALLASNAWRAVLWRAHTDWRIVGRFAMGAAVAFALMFSVRFVPSRSLALIVLGLSPFIALAVPARLAPQAERRMAAEICGFVCQVMHLLSGVTGPLLDIFFVRSTGMDRRTVVATKATCQVLGHTSKLAYFGGALGAAELSAQWWHWGVLIGCAVAGTSLSRAVLERITDAQFRRWTRTIVLGIGTVYLIQGVASMM